MGWETGRARGGIGEIPEAWNVVGSVRDVGSNVRDAELALEALLEVVE